MTRVGQAAVSPTLQSPGASPERRRLLARVHQLKKALGLDDDAYRDALERETGQRSAAALDDAALRDVLARLSRHLPAAERAAFTGGRRPRSLKEPFQRKARALWIGLWNLGAIADGSDAALDAFVARQTKVSTLAFLRAGDAPALIEALKHMLAREGVSEDSRLGLVRAQWRRVADIKSDNALERWLAKAVTPGLRSVLQLSDDQLDQASRKLGDWIRRSKAAP